MRALTGLGSFDWFLLGLYALAGAVCLRTRSRLAPGTRVFGFHVVSLVAGLAACAALLGAYPGESRRAFEGVFQRAAALGVAAGIVIVAFALVDFLLRNAVAFPAQRLSRFSRGTFEVGDLLSALVVGVAAVVAIVGLSKLAEPRSAPEARSERVRVSATYHLGAVTDLVFAKGAGYAALDDGRVIRFELPTSGKGQPHVQTLARVEHPRGLAVLGATLFVSALGPLPCDPRPCPGYAFPGAATESGDKRYITETSGRVLAFDIQAGGGLVRRRVIAAHLPVANTLHAVNGITAGPDGFLYLPIGNVDALYRHPKVVEKLDVPRRILLGTIVRFRPDGSHFEVLARGLRNVYKLTFDPTGNLYGVDNNGPTLGGWREEELLRIRKGANYGYPYNGTYAPYTVRTDPPLYTVPVSGSAGITWASNVGLHPGIVVGDCGGVEYVPLRRKGSRVEIERPSAALTLLDVPGCVSAIEAGPENTMVLGVYPYAGQDEPSLYVTHIDD
jgi:Glucose / Sorbosone dehydrogenase